MAVVRHDDGYLQSFCASVLKVGPENVPEFLHESLPGESLSNACFTSATHLLPERVIGKQSAHGVGHRTDVKIRNANAGVVQHLRCPAGVHESHHRKPAL